MFCLDVTNNVEPIWIGEDKAICDYSPLIASEDRVLAVGAGGELILVDAKADEFRVVSRLKLFGEDPSQRAEVLAHPALVGTRLYFRGENELVCVELAPETSAEYAWAVGRGGPTQPSMVRRLVPGDAGMVLAASKSLYAPLL